MARRVGPVKVRRYSLEFKLKAVKLSQLKGVEVQAVADALEIHPFMLSRWRKEPPSHHGYDGTSRGTENLFLGAFFISISGWVGAETHFSSAFLLHAG